jgi:subtilase family serine protease
LDGTGQIVGLIEFDTFVSSDVNDYLNLIGAPPTQINNISEVPVNGGASPGPDQDEVLLDIDTVASLAPGAKIVVYDGPFTGSGSSFQARFNAAISGGSTVISNSWAYCEDQTTAADVQSIDTIFQAAAVAGISIFNGSGDSGSTCLDGSPNVISVPADSPNATAVGGSSLNLGSGNTYSSETWWNGTSATPPTGQGGFGTSRFFSVPLYQSGLSGSTMRSVPDTVINADPFEGVQICQASKGGCPNGLLYGGTSMAAPAWAASAAIINQALGKNTGTFNQAIYPFGDTTAFHNAASLGSDFAHVGLGSPNLNQLYLKLSNQTNTAVSPTLSGIFPYTEGPLGSSPAPFADGTTKGFVNVRLLDTNGNPVGGKTITLAASPSSNVQITPASGVSAVDGGVAVFTLTDTVPEELTLTATDTTDNIQLAPSTTPTISFATAPATSASIGAAPTSVPNDGVSITTISITLTDSLGRAAPGKQIQLSHTGSSVVGGRLQA